MSKKPTPEPEAVEPPAEPWRTTIWAGLPNYECVRCPYATLDIDRIRSHRCELNH